MSRHPDLEKHFHTAMTLAYRKMVAETDYLAEDFLKQLKELGGVDAAKVHLRAGDASNHFTELWNRSRLDLSVEAFAIKPQWRQLFTEEELATALQRLIDYDYVP